MSCGLEEKGKEKEEGKSIREKEQGEIEGVNMKRERGGGGKSRGNVKRVNLQRVVWVIGKEEERGREIRINTLWSDIRLAQGGRKEGREGEGNGRTKRIGLDIRHFVLCTLARKIEGREGGIRGKRRYGWRERLRGNRGIKEGRREGERRDGWRDRFRGNGGRRGGGREKGETDGETDSEEERAEGYRHQSIQTGE